MGSVNNRIRQYVNDLLRLARRDMEPIHVSATGGVEARVPRSALFYLYIRHTGDKVMGRESTNFSLTEPITMKGQQRILIETQLIGEEVLVEVRRLPD